MLPCRTSDDCEESHYCLRCGAHVYDLMETVCSTCIGEGIKWSLYLDDERHPTTSRFWLIVRTAQEARELVQKMGCPHYISFDHDLGSLDENETGYGFAKWMVEADLDGRVKIPGDFQFNVHSANIAGRRNIEGLLKGYLQYRAV